MSAVCFNVLNYTKDPDSYVEFNLWHQHLGDSGIESLVNSLLLSTTEGEIDSNDGKLGQDLDLKENENSNTEIETEMGTGTPQNRDIIRRKSTSTIPTPTPTNKGHGQGRRIISALQTLNLCGNELGDNGVSSLTDVMNNGSLCFPNLRHLYLQDNYIRRLENLSEVLRSETIIPSALI